MIMINPFFATPVLPSNTLILMPFNNTSSFTDIANNHAITVVGAPEISNTQSKFGNGSLSITAGNYLKIDTTPTLDLGGQRPMTFEFWVYMVSATKTILSTANSSGGAPVTNFVIRQANSSIGGSSFSFWQNYGGTNIPLNQWAHVALVLDGTYIAQYVNGVGVHIFPAPDYYPVHPNWPYGDHFLNIGRGQNADMVGYLNDLRISDIAVYTSDFTPPTAPFTL